MKWMYIKSAAKSIITVLDEMCRYSDETVQLEILLFGSRRSHFLKS